jgi:hypothetical protein
MALADAVNAELPGADALPAGPLPPGAALFCIFGVSPAAARVGAAEVVWVDACAGAVLPVKPTAIAIATAAIDNAPKIHGRRSLSSVIARLSS